MESVVLIGMPGSGKSTVGVLLAKELCLEFVDTDILIQSRTGRALQEILDAEGIPGFLAVEEETLLGFRPSGMVVATGGSVIYSDAAMERLSAGNVVVYLDCGVDSLGRRLSNLDSRGVVRAPGQTVAALHAERDPLYRKWAHLVVDNGHDDHEGVVAEIARRIRSRSN